MLAWLKIEREILVASYTIEYTYTRVIYAVHTTIIIYSTEVGMKSESTSNTNMSLIVVAKVYMLWVYNMSLIVYTCYGREVGIYTYELDIVC